MKPWFQLNITGAYCIAEKDAFSNIVSSMRCKQKCLAKGRAQLHPEQIVRIGYCRAVSAKVQISKGADNTFAPTACAVSEKEINEDVWR